MLPESDARGVESLLEQVTLVQQAMGDAGVGIVGARRMVGLAPGQQGVLAGGVQAVDGTPAMHRLAGLQAAIAQALEQRVDVGRVFGGADRRKHPERRQAVARGDRKSTRLNSVTNAHLVCRLLLEKKKKA